MACFCTIFKGIGLVSNKSGILCLTNIGENFAKLQSKRYLANLLHAKYRLFGEVLKLIECVGNRKWGLTTEGKSAVHEWSIISGDVVDMTLTEKEEISILPPPIEIMELLSALKENPELHKKRNTYNVWSPSPNRIENLRMVVQYICM